MLALIIVYSIFLVFHLRFLTGNNNENRNNMYVFLLGKFFFGIYPSFYLILRDLLIKINYYLNDPSHFSTKRDLILNFNVFLTLISINNER